MLVFKPALVVPFNSFNIAVNFPKVLLRADNLVARSLILQSTAREKNMAGN